MVKRMGAEELGTFWLVFGGCGSAILAAKFLDAQNSNSTTASASWGSPWPSA
jgi:glycerol uptake facilitator-like aquaporin